MADHNHQHIYGSVGEVNGIKADKVFIQKIPDKRRSQMLKELLYYRHHCYALHLILINYARDNFHIKGDFKFIELSDNQLEQLYQFSRPLKKVLFVYQKHIPNQHYKWAYKLAYFFHQAEIIFLRLRRK